jgi:hypothetical protein
MTIKIFPTRRVVCAATVRLPLSARVVWGQLRDFQTSARHDPFHAVIHVEGNVPRAGAGLEIVHRHLLWRSVRIGRILRWKEGCGFAFSDLCKSDVQRAFPHVLSYRLEAESEKSCELQIMVRGQWTAGGPRWIGRLWLWWVFSQVVRSVENQLLRFAVGLRSIRNYESGNLE